MSFVAVAIGGSALLGFGGSLLGASAANNAANTQANSANYAAQLQSQEAQNALDFQKQQYGTSQQELAPFLQSGYGALANLNYLLGLPNSDQPLYQYGQQSNPTSAGVTGNLPDIPNIPQYIPGAHGEEMPNPAYLQAQQHAAQGTTTGITAQPQNSLASLVNPNLGAFGSLNQGWDQTFQAPTNVTEQNDPGYQFRLQQGQQALERSAAAKGNLLTGGTAKDLTDYAQGAASNEYQNVYNRALEGYQTNYNTFANNQANQYNRLASMAGLGQTTAQNLGSLGQSAAGNVSNISLTAGNQIGQNINNAGAARASGYVGSANALGQGLSGIGNGLSSYLMLSQLMGGGGGIGQMDTLQSLGYNPNIGALS